MGREENIFITWHYTNYGVAYLKHILAAFYKGIVSLENLNAEGISQTEMNNVFDQQEEGFVFDKVYYLVSEQRTFDKLSSRRFSQKTILTDELIIQNGLREVWQDLLDMNITSIEDQEKFVRSNYSSLIYKRWLQMLWRNIHKYTIDDQIKWLKNFSNIHPRYKDKNFEDINLKVNNLRYIEEIAEKVYEFITDIKSRHPYANFIINVSLGSNETQVVWHIFSEMNLLPYNTRLIKTYDNKLDTKQRFKDFSITEVPTKIFTRIHSKISLYEKPHSTSRVLAELKMQQYINSGFAVLLLGERGTGKTRLANKYKQGKKIVAVNCASFTNNTLAQSILFGYKKGAFTGANKDTPGVFEQANGGILFLDEIHHLDKEMQAKLMKAIETDENNNFTIRRLGDDKDIKVNLTLILASNNTIDELREKLLPDFYDRITQLVIELPPLRDTPEEIPGEFRKIWAQMKFELFYPFDEYVADNQEFFQWLKKQKLYGNYRDLQKISIYYKTYLDARKENPNMLKLMKVRSVLDFVKNEYEKYISVNRYNSDDQWFSENKTAEQMVKCFKKKLAQWAIERFGTGEKAQEHFAELGGQTTKETLYRWRNEKC